MKYFMEHRFKESEVNFISNAINDLRALAPGNIASMKNMNFSSVNTRTWWKRNRTALNKVEQIKDKLLEPISKNDKDRAIGYRMVIRNVPSITGRNQGRKSYINVQTLHRNYETDPNRGESFKQVIYYVDTPKYTNGRVANVGNRGRLLLRSPNGNAQIFTPEKGRAVYFNPLDIHHEVLPQENRNQNVNVDRKMVIMFLYKRPTSNVSASVQIPASSGLQSLVRSLVGFVPRPTKSIRNQNANSLVSMMGRVSIRRPVVRRRITRPRNDINLLPQAKRRKVNTRSQAKRRRIM